MAFQSNSRKYSDLITVWNTPDKTYTHTQYARKRWKTEFTLQKIHKQQTNPTILDIVIAHTHNTSPLSWTFERIVTLIYTNPFYIFLWGRRGCAFLIRKEQWNKSFNAGETYSTNFYCTSTKDLNNNTVDRYKKKSPRKLIQF